MLYDNQIIWIKRFTVDFYAQVENMYFILTAKSLLWVTLSVVSTITLFTAIYSPKWLIGPTDYNCLSAKSLNESKSMKIINKTVLEKKSGWEILFV